MVSDLPETPTLSELLHSLRDAFTGEPGKGRDWTHLVADQPPISRSERIGIYANAYFWRLLEGLSDDYEATGKSITWLRDYEFFSGLMREYLTKYPSRSEDIGEVGDSLTKFLAEHEIGLAHPWLVELSRLEKLYLETFFCALPSPLSAESLQTLAQAGGSARLRLNPSVRLLRSSWPILGLWRKRKGAQRITFPKKAKEQRLFLRRTPDKLIVESIEPAAFELLEGLGRGETLEASCAAIESKLSDPALLTAWFQKWVGEGLFCEVTLAH